MNTALAILPNFALIVVGLVLARRFDFGRDFGTVLAMLTIPAWLAAPLPA